MKLNEEKSLDISKLSGFFKNRDNVICAFLFGSAVDGMARPGGDVDIAVLTGKNTGKPCMLDIYVGVSKVLHDIERIDIVSLNTAEPILAFEAVSGRKIADNDPPKTAEFISLTSCVYEDVMANLEYQRTLKNAS